jgi:hypothetical protein
VGVGTLIAVESVAPEVILTVDSRSRAAQHAGRRWGLAMKGPWGRAVLDKICIDRWELRWFIPPPLTRLRGVVSMCTRWHLLHVVTLKPVILDGPRRERWGDWGNKSGLGGG